MPNPIYVVAFDILHKDTDPQKLEYSLLTDFDDSCHIEQSVWLVESSLGLSGVKARVLRYLSHLDRLIVSRVEGTVGAQNLDHNGIQWLDTKGVKVV